MVAEPVQQLPQVPHASPDVRRRVEGPADREPPRRRGHQLHEAARALAGDGARPEVGLGPDERRDERGVDVGALRLGRMSAS